MQCPGTLLRGFSSDKQTVSEASAAPLIISQTNTVPEENVLLLGGCFQDAEACSPHKGKRNRNRCQKYSIWLHGFYKPSLFP